MASAVADTGPLVALAKIDQLDLLLLLFGGVLIPSVVEQELLTKRSVESQRLEAVLGKHLQVVTIPEIAPEVQAATWNLDRGEAGALALAYGRHHLYWYTGTKFISKGGDRPMSTTQPAVWP